MTFAPACLHTAGLMNLFRPNQELLGRSRELSVVQIKVSESVRIRGATKLLLYSEDWRRGST